MFEIWPYLRAQEVQEVQEVPTQDKTFHNETEARFRFGLTKELKRMDHTSSPMKTYTRLNASAERCATASIC